MKSQSTAKKQLGSGYTTLGISLLLLALPLAPASASEWIVRFRQAQSPQSIQTFTAQKFGRLTAAETGLTAKLLNEEEGIARLTFESDHDALQALAPLQARGEILSVTPNHYYRPAVIYRSQAVSSRAAVLAPTYRALSLWDELADFITPRRPSPPVTAPEAGLPGAVLAGQDPLVAQDWALRSIGLPNLDSPEFQAASSPITAAVIDTGVDYNHEDLIGAMWRNPDDAREVGYDFAHQNNRPYDQRHFDIDNCMKDDLCRSGMDQEKFMSNPGHGTHCAGHVGAVANNSLGIRGVSPAGASATRVMALKFFYNAGEANAGSGDDAAAIQSIDYAIKHGAKVISASWGGRMSRASAERSELKQALIRAQQAGVLVVIAAGNDGIDQDADEETRPDFPAAYELDNLIVVAASDSKDQLADFSNYGARTVHLAAPGVRILSTTVGSQYSDVVATYKDPRGSSREILWNGTSMATPIVAGAVSLVWSKHPSESYSQIRARILKNVRPVASLQGKVSTGGVLDVTASLR